MYEYSMPCSAISGPQWRLPLALCHEKRTTLPEILLKPGMAFNFLSKLGEMVVQLKFEQGNANYSGTGFFINIPDVVYDVILTAAHNLIDGNRERSRDLKVVTINETIRVQEHQIYISESYQNNPHQENSDNDYGVILLCREEKRTLRPSFGFSLSLAADSEDGHNSNIPKEMVSVTGYRDSDSPGEVTTSSGSFRIRSSEKIEYEVTTEPGLSGSPVWTSYEGRATAIAIHNYGEGRERSGWRRGTRLSLRVLRDVFRWTNAGHMFRALKVDHPEALPRGLYLRFSEDTDFGRVRLGAEDLETGFDIIPAETGPTGVSKTINPRYAFYFCTPPSGPRKQASSWVLWDAEQSMVTLTENLHPWCLVELKVPKKKKKPNTYQIIIVRDSERLLFKMEANRIQERDTDLGIPVESSEIFFGKEGGAPEKFTEFVFEEYAIDPEN